MIAHSALIFTLRNIIDRAGFDPAPQHRGRGRRWQRVVEALEDWWTTSYLAWRGEIPSRDYAERFHRFCRDCGEDTPHRGVDEFGVGWYAEIYCCQYCGGQSMRIWPLL